MYNVVVYNVSRLELGRRDLERGAALRSLALVFYFRGTILVQGNEMHASPDQDKRSHVVGCGQWLRLSSCT